MEVPFGPRHPDNADTSDYLKGNGTVDELGQVFQFRRQLSRPMCDLAILRTRVRTFSVLHGGP